MGLCVSKTFHDKTVEQLCLDLEAAKAENDMLSDLNDKANNKVTQLEKSLKSEKKAHRGTSKELDALTNKHTAAAAELDLTSTQASDMEAELAKVREQFEVVETKERKLSAEHAAQAQALKLAQVDNVHFAAKTTKLATETANLTAENTQLTAELTSTQDQFANFSEEAKARERHLVRLARGSQSMLSDTDREDEFKPPRPKPEEVAARAAKNWKNLATKCKVKPAVVDTGAADHATAPTTAAERRRDSANSATDDDKNKPWKQPLLPKIPIKLIDGMHEVANGQAPPGVFD